MKFYLIAGEASGDLHGSNLVKQLKIVQPNAEFIAWGGDKMQHEGCRIDKHITETSFMGFAEVIKHLPQIQQNFKDCKASLIQEKPDALILIDYPGFNLRIAKFAKNLGLKVYYYISPQLWAWKKNRYKLIKKYVDHLIVILPFEQQFYKELGIETYYPGHPLLDAIKKPEVLGEFKNEKTIAVLAGSRAQELRKMLPEILKLSQLMPTFKFELALGPQTNKESISPLLNEYSNVQISEKSTYQTIQNAVVAIVKSGTSTLETAILGTPQVVIYKTSNLSYLIGKQIVKIKFISLVNLILNRELVKELIQNEMTANNIKAQVENLLPGNANREKVLTGYDELIHLLGDEGASKRTADFIVSKL